MVEATVSTNVRTIDERVSVIDITGSVTRKSEPELTDAYNKASGPLTRAIVLNFTALEYMNSSGIGLLVTLLVRANRQEQKLLAYGLSDHYKDIFGLTRLNEAIHIYDNEGTALAAAYEV
ncbi:MAG TPA: STAS domain-containing protein [Thermomicrobiales bacterium]|nr:STAS domain-containing protein [Thermomicrobiales bacterium]